jgi:hypothetical protein
VVHWSPGGDFVNGLLRDAFGIGLLFQPQGTFQENELIVRLEDVHEC